MADQIKVAYWPGCVSRGFTPELHGSMAIVAQKLGIELVELDRSTLGRNLRVLEKLGLVQLGPGKDQREQVADLTPSGRLSLLAGDPLWDRAQADIADRIGAGGVTQLEALLGAL